MSAKRLIIWNNFHPLNHSPSGVSASKPVHSIGSIDQEAMKKAIKKPMKKTAGGRE